MKVLVSGAHGLVGNALLPALQAGGFEVRPLARDPTGGAISWDPKTGALNRAAFEQFAPEAFVHLAGENIAKRRWSAEQKRRIRESRTASTARLAQSLLQLKAPPRIYVCASAVGFYGNRGEELLTESSVSGTDFLSQVAREWEMATDPLRAAGYRVAHLRFGMILSSNGGALTRLLPIFKAGLGGPLGSGKQWMSWVALTDVLSVIQWVLRSSTASGPYNVVAPNPVTNAEFTRILARVLHRPAIFRVPAVMLRLSLGELADALLLGSQRAVPERLLAENFQFQLPELERALHAELHR